MPLTKKIYTKFNYFIIENIATGSTVEIPSKDVRYLDNGNVYTFYDNRNTDVKDTVIFDDTADVNGVAFASQSAFLQFLRINTGDYRTQETGDLVNNAVAVIPNDSTDLSINPAKLYVGTGGNLRVTLVGGNTVTFTNIIGGTFLPIKVVRVFATNTTASNILALW